MCDVYYKILTLLDIDASVLVAAVRLLADRQHDQWRITAYGIEIRERCKIIFVLCDFRQHPGDWPGYQRLDHVVINLCRFEF